MVKYLTELFYDGQWNDITPDVRDKAPIVMGRGRRDWASKADPATCTLRLNNGASQASQGVQGRYSPRNPRSDLFGKIGRNTPLRVRRADGLDAALELPGVDGSYASAPDAAALDITGDIDIRVEMEPYSWRPDVTMDVVSKYLSSGDERSWHIVLQTGGGLRFRWSPDGTFSGSFFADSDDVIPEDTTRLAFRVKMDVDDGAGNVDVTFETAETIEGPYTQLGNVQTGAFTTSIFSSTAELAIGSQTAGVAAFSDSDVFRGKIHAVEVYDGIDGTRVASPDFRELEPTVRTFDDAEGNTWTLNDQALITDASIRFSGEVQTWPPEWDLSGADRWVNVRAFGMTRRLQKGSKPIKSSLFRELSELDEIVAYWPLEDRRGATRFQSGLPDDESFLTATPSSEVTLAADADTFVASAPLPTVGAGEISGDLPVFSGSDDQRFVFLVSIPADVTWDSDRVLASFATTGSVVRWDVIKTSGDDTRLIAYDKDDNELENLLTTLPMFGAPSAISLWLQQDGANVDWQLAQFELGETSGITSGTNSITGETFGRFKSVQLGSDDDMEGTTFGHGFLLDDDVQTFWNAFFDSIVGWAGETAVDRLLRLSSDEGLPVVRVIGVGSTTEDLGAQPRERLMDAFRESRSADLGILIDRRDTLGLQYRTREDLYVNEPVLTLDYSGGMIEDLRPVDDDQNIVNDVTVTRTRGASFTAVDTTGPLSSLDPPDGVGRYDVEQEINVELDTRLQEQAGWRLRQGTVDEMRVPELVLNLRNPQAATQEDTILAVGVGDVIRVTNPPVWLPAASIDLFVEAISEKKTTATHEITFTCSPASAWHVGVYDEDEGVAESRYSSDGTTITEDLTETETSIDISTPSGPVWGDDDAPYDILIGGERMRVTAVSGTSAAQTITVSRSIDGVVKTHESGAEMTLFKPTYYAL